jgi:molybdopterin-guanine dinucleotide biosynthesis protein A
MQKFDMSGFVLAGGKSSRLKQDKVLLPWQGGTLLDHAIERLQQISSPVRVCADRKDLASRLPPSVTVVRDALPGAGPLGGIVAGLEESHTEWNCFLAIDLPLLPVALLRALAEQAESSRVKNEGTLCILPQMDGFPQPLCGLYHRSLRDGLRGALEEGKYKITLALEDAVRRVEGRMLHIIGPGLGMRKGPAMGTPASRVELFDAAAFAGAGRDVRDWFLNINTPQDWQRANVLAASQAGSSESENSSA